MACPQHFCPKHKPPRASYSWGCEVCRGDDPLSIYCGGWPASKYCVWCGAFLGQKCGKPDCGRYLPRTMLFCDQCGTSTEFKDEYDEVCGQNKNLESEYEQEYGRKVCCRWFCFFLFLNILVFCGIFLVWILFDSSENK